MRLRLDWPPKEGRKDDWRLGALIHGVTSSVRESGPLACISSDQSAPLTSLHRLVSHLHRLAQAFGVPSSDAPRVRRSDRVGSSRGRGRHGRLGEVLSKQNTGGPSLWAPGRPWKARLGWMWGIDTA